MFPISLPGIAEAAHAMENSASDGYSTNGESVKEAERLKRLASIRLCPGPSSA
jgi:hypothetical protein